MCFSSLGSLIFLNPTLDYSSFWEVLWVVGITDFILKFLFMGLKCLILLVPSFIMPFKSKGYWYMLLEELCQYYRTFVPIPVWFRYLISYGEFGNVTRWSLGILLALLYLILKLLDFFGHLRTFRRVLRIFVTRPVSIFYHRKLFTFFHCKIGLVQQLQMQTYITWLFRNTSSTLALGVMMIKRFYFCDPFLNLCIDNTWWLMK